MKKVLILTLALCIGIVANAQELPYSKYLNFSKKEFRENGFKYDDETNTWGLRKVNGWRATFNVLAFLADASEDVHPGRNDYSILVQMGRDNEPAYVKVIYYNDDTFHKLLTFMKDNGNDIVDTSSGKLIKYQAYYNTYGLELNMEQHIVSRTSARTADNFGS